MLFMRNVMTKASLNQDIDLTVAWLMITNNKNNDFYGIVTQPC